MRAASWDPRGFMFGAWTNTLGRAVQFNGNIIQGATNGVFVGEGGNRSRGCGAFIHTVLDGADRGQ